MMPNRVPVEVMNLWLDQVSLRVRLQRGVHVLFACLRLVQDEVAYIIGGENARVKLKDIADEVRPKIAAASTLT